MVGLIRKSMDYNRWKFYQSKICLIILTMLFTIEESNLYEQCAEGNLLLDANGSNVGAHTLNFGSVVKTLSASQ